MSDQSVNNNSKSPLATAGIVVIAVVAVLSFILCFVPLPMTCPPCKGKGDSGYDGRYKKNDKWVCRRCEGSGIEYRVYGIRTYTAPTDKHVPAEDERR